MNRKYTGKELAKVLIYYGLIEDVTTSQFKIVCPFHGDVNPSMQIDLQKGTFFCFGCGEFGYAPDFVRLVNPELNELQVYIVTERILNSNEIKKLRIKYRKKRKVNNKQAIVEAKDYYCGLSKTDWNNPETKEERYVLEYMSKRGFDAKALNLGSCKASYNIAYPVLFPILDNGRFRGYVARTTNSYVESKRKYLYNEGFYKRTTLCGNYSEKCVPYICEGYMDYLSLRSRGDIEYVVAILGWHISDEQVKALKEKGITTVISALDNDNCGIKGTEYLKKFFNVIRFQYPKDKKDPGEMSRKQIKIAIRKTERSIKKQ